MNPFKCHLCSSETMRLTVEEGWIRCPGCEAMLFHPNDGPRVGLLHSSETISAQIGSVLLREGMYPLRLVDVEEAMLVMGREPVPGLVLDVGLETTPFFAVVSRIRDDLRLAGTKIVLVASVYNKTAYKRRPTSLYGADAYVEEHHVTDHLPARLGELIHVPVQAAPSAEEFDAVNARIEEAERLRTLAGEARIRAMAQRIVADIALYMEREVDEARAGEIGESLTAALEEGRRVLTVLSGAAKISGDPIGEAFEGVRLSPRRVR